MTLSKVFTPAALAVGLTLLAPLAAVRAQEAPAAPTLAPADTVRSLLERQQGQPATLRLLGGEELTGTVVKVNDHVVQLARLSNRDFYDAFVPLDKVVAVIVKARSK